MTAKFYIIAAAVLALLAVATSATAQIGGYTIQPPGQLPTYANPTPNRGLHDPTARSAAHLRQPDPKRRLRDPTARPVADRCLPDTKRRLYELTPGQLPTYATPTPNGGYTIQRPASCQPT